MNDYTTAKKVLAGVLLINILLVSTHQGEFWPFSIFPMFSQAGNPWTRALVERVEDPEQADLWSNRTLEELQSRAIGLYARGVDPIDFANFIGKTETWDRKRIAAMRELLDASRLEKEYWMVNRIRGHLTEGDTVILESTPLFLLSVDTTLRNPRFFP